MFWRLGSEELSRPVAAPVWLKLVWIRPVFRLTRGRQRVHVGALELLQLAVLENQPRQLVAHGGELLQHVGVGGGPVLVRLSVGSCCFSNSTVASCRRIEVERFARHRGDLAFQPPHVGSQLGAEPGEDLPVDGDPVPLHVHQHLHERHLDVAKQRLELHPSMRRAKKSRSARTVGAVLAAVGRRCGDAHLGERDLRLPPPRQSW